MMAKISIPVTAFMATLGLADVEDGNMIDWKRGDEAWWIPSPYSKYLDPLLVVIDSGRGAHPDAPENTDDLWETVYEVIFPDDGQRYSVSARQLRHKNFKPILD